ncbi:MAG: hypothetical protein HFE84_03260 [Lachnospiraceae bacterium]|nr:hypothetical protein [Lachnospiraceae bacterium]
MIRSTFAGFNMSVLALTASQRCLDVTGQNLSNVNTEGYTRQRLDLASISPVGHGFSSSPFDSKVGQGVMMMGVSQIRDPFLDNQYRYQLPKVGTADAMSSILGEIRNVFDETDKEAIRLKLADIVSQLDNLAHTENAGTSSADNLVRSACEVLLNQVHQNATDIKDVSDQLINKLETAVIPDIQSCLNQIKELNESIKNSQILGNPALELQDQRNMLIDELATYFPIEVKYNEKNMGGGIKVDTLQIDVVITDPKTGKRQDPVTLIDDIKIGNVEVIPTKTPPNDDKVAPVQLQFTDTEGNLWEGETQDAQGNPIPTNDASNWIADGVLRGDLDMLNKSEVFDGTDIKGIGYYGKMFDAWVNEFATALNDMNRKAVYDEKGNLTGYEDQPLFETSDGSKHFTAENIRVSNAWMTGAVSITLSQEFNPGSTDYSNVLRMMQSLQTDKHNFYKSDSEGFLLDENNDPLEIGGKQVKVNADGYLVEADGKTLIVGQQNAQNIKIDAAGNLLYKDGTDAKAESNNKLPVIAFRGTMFECYDNIQTTQGVEEKAYRSILKNHETVLDQIANSKESVSGVYIDEEVTNLMRFSQAYNAASRLMTTMDEILDKLINSTGVVGR